MSAIASRSARAQDLDLLAEMNAGLIREEGSRNPMDLAGLRHRLAGWLASGAWRIDLFLVGDEVVGYAAYRRETDAASRPSEVLAVRQFYIRETWRGRGLGRAAMAHLIARRAGPGIACRLEVLASNPAGRAFWDALGFRPFSTTMERIEPE